MLLISILMLTAGKGFSEPQASFRNSVGLELTYKKPILELKCEQDLAFSNRIEPIERIKPSSKYKIRKKLRGTRDPGLVAWNPEAELAMASKVVVQIRRGEQAFTNLRWDKAFEWLSKAAKQGSVKAQDKLGWMYKHGRGIDKDYELSIKWYTNAAEQGFPSA